MSVPSKIFKRITTFSRRCHKIIHVPDCTCNITQPCVSTFTNMAIKLFKAAQSEDHPLHFLIPRRLPRSNRFEVEFSRTLRRQKTFPCNVVLFLNSFTWSSLFMLSCSLVIRKHFLLFYLFYYDFHLSVNKHFLSSFFQNKSQNRFTT